MIAYKREWLTNLKLRERAEQEMRRGNITDAEFKAIVAKYPVGFYTPGIGARIGLFILTCVIIGFGDGLLALMAGSSNLISSAAFPIFLGLLTYGGLELMVYAQRHYRSGVDDALLFIAACQFSAAFFMMFLDHGGSTSYAGISVFIFVLTLFFTIRFADTLISAACCCAFLAIVFFEWTSMVPSGLTTAPFIMMLTSAGVCWFTYTNRTKFANYENCFAIGQIISLLALYAAGNYYVVQSLSAELNGQTGPLPFGAFFWIWTILAPFVYVWFGIKKKDAILLRTGLLLVIAAALTFRNYYHLLPLDVTLTIVGAILLAIAYSIMRHLKTPKYGFTYAEPDEEHMMDHLKVESLLVAESFSTPSHAPTDSGTKFGGGDFGGGGSSESF